MNSKLVDARALHEGDSIAWINGTRWHTPPLIWGGWALFCPTHHCFLSLDNRAEARKGASRPTTVWCLGCQVDAERKAAELSGLASRGWHFIRPDVFTYSAAGLRETVTCNCGYRGEAGGDPSVADAERHCREASRPEQPYEPVGGVK